MRKRACRKSKDGQEFYHEQHFFIDFNKNSQV
jgi:hypothetical protein